VRSEVNVTTDIHPTSIVEDGAELGPDVQVGEFSIVRSSATIGEGSVIGSHCEIGYGTDSFAGRLTMGANATIRSHSILYTASTIGDRFETGHRAIIREHSSIGDSVRIGSLSDIEGTCTIGSYVRIHSGVFVPAETTIGDYVWLFPYVVITNDPYPPSDRLAGVTIEPYAAVGARSVLLPGVTVGADSLVAAGAVVSRDVAPGTVVAGVPARELADASTVQLGDGSGQAYPWRRQYQHGYSTEVIEQWKQEFPNG